MLRNIVIIGCGLLMLSCSGKAQAPKKEKVFPVQKTDAEWRTQLTPEQYHVLRKAGTERPFSSELNKNYKAGTYYCAACNEPLFDSKYKFDSGTGWPSFDRGINGQIEYSTDYKLGYGRTEEHCANCGGHLGHVFDDGPRDSTGKRHCINGDALVFVPKGQALIKGND